MNDLLVPLLVLVLIIVIVLVILWFMGVIKLPGAARPATPAAPVAAAPAVPAAPAPAGPYGAGSAAALADGSAPAGFTIKGNADSMLFHTTDSPYYGRTKAEAWFATEADAERAGFKRWDRKG
jgi:large subunit ribosomal protein L4